jgi:hypothetical protein
MKLKLDEIMLDSSLALRVETNSPTVSEYEERLTEGEQFPPLLVWRQEGQDFLLDGWHRFTAMVNAGFVDAECKMITGTKLEALIAAAVSNRNHGLPMSRADKRKAVVKLVEASGNLSSRQVAEAVGVSAYMVDTIRKESGAKIKQVTGKDGKKYPVAKVKRDPVEKEEGNKKETEDVPDPGIGGDSLSPDELSKSDKKDGLTKGQVVQILDDSINEMLNGDLSDMAGNLIKVKVWVLNR